MSSRPQIIFFGNGMLADFAKPVIAESGEIIFHARTREDLEKVAQLKQQHPEAHGILASFGVIVPPRILALFEPGGIINLHPSLLPKFRGASPIESAILAGAQDFSFSIMKLARKMDAGPIFYQKTYNYSAEFPGEPLEKARIYQLLAENGAKWIMDNLLNLPKPQPQNDAAATYCGKFDKNMSMLDPQNHTAKEIFRQIVAYQGYPKPKFDFFGKTCIILEAHLAEDAGAKLALTCADGKNVAIDRLQPEGKKPMDAKSFLNGYGKDKR